MIPIITPIVRGLAVSWAGQVTLADLEFFQVFYGLTSPPSILFGETASTQVVIQGLEPGTLYYVQVFAFDCFGPGQGSGISSGTPLDDTGVDGSGSAVLGGSVNLTLTAQDIIKVTVTTEAGNLVYLWACADILHTAAGIGILTLRRQEVGGANPIDLRESRVLTPGASEKVTGHVNLLDSPPAGTWEYVLRAHGNLTGMVLSGAYIDMLLKR